MLGFYYVKKEHPDARLPQRAAGSIGYDLYALEDVTIPSLTSAVLNEPLQNTWPGESQVGPPARNFGLLYPENDPQKNIKPGIISESSLQSYSNIRVVRTGISISFEGSYGAFLWDRSSMGAKGLDAVGFYRDDVSIRLAGCIEGSYRGEYKVVLANISTQPYIIRAGDKIAQIVFQPVELPEAQAVEMHFLDSDRGSGGFGSTGK